MVASGAVVALIPPNAEMNALAGEEQGQEWAVSLIEEYYDDVVIHCNKSLRMVKYKVEWKVVEDTAEGRLSSIEELVVVDNIGAHPDPNTDSANQPQL